ncbi:unnamed protein product [Heterobilharzia americana]|nr:unnamed protein product [Heterobilharzia americana]
MSTVYVDRGMAWCTVVGGFVANLLLGGLGKSYSLVMEAFQDVFQCGSAYLFLAGGLIYTLMYCLSLVNHLISKRYGSRPVVMAGAFGSCISLLVAACSPNLTLWVFAIGFGVGASLSCIYFTVFAVVGCCFKRYLGLANGISVAGVSVGQMVFPSLITYLNATYSARGGTVIMAAICLHLLVTAVLMPRHIIDPDSPPPPLSSTPPEKVESSKTKKRLHRKLKSKEGKQLMSTKDLLSDTQDINDGVDAKLNNAVDEFLSKLDDQRDMVHSISVAKAFGDVGDVSVSFIAPLFGTELALSASTVNRAIAIAGVGDLVTRVGVGWLTDRPACVGRRGLLLAFTWLIEGLNAFAFAELNRLSGKYDANSSSNDDSLSLKACYFICFAIHGICSGTAMTQMVVVLCDWVGSSELAQSLAVTMVILGLVISPGQFLMGFIADYTGTYIWSMQICGLILLLAGFILLLEFPVRRLYPTDKNNNDKLYIERCVAVDEDVESAKAAQVHDDGVVNGSIINGKHHSPMMNSITSPMHAKWEIIDSDRENTTEHLNTTKSIQV